MHLAARFDYYKIGQLLLNYGADANARSAHQATPLHEVNTLIALHFCIENVILLVTSIMVMEPNELRNLRTQAAMNGRAHMTNVLLSAGELATAQPNPSLTNLLKDLMHHRPRILQ